MALYDSCDSTELSGELNENRHHQIYITTCDEMYIKKVPKGAPDSNGLDQYDYADMSAGDSTSGTSQLQIASLSQEEQYAILNPNVTGFHRNFTVRNKTRPEQYELAMPTSNISEIAVHLDLPEEHCMVSNESCYDHAQENRSICNSEINNIYNHSIDRVYDSAKTDLINNTNSDRYMDFKENYGLCSKDNLFFKKSSCYI